MALSLPKKRSPGCPTNEPAVPSSCWADSWARVQSPFASHHNPARACVSPAGGPVAASDRRKSSKVMSSRLRLLRRSRWITPIRSSLNWTRKHDPAGPSNRLRQCWRTQSESAKLPSVDEGRKRVLLIAASILAARKLAQHGSEAQVPATICAIADAIRWAERIMNEIDRRWPKNETSLH